MTANLFIVYKKHPTLTELSERFEDLTKATGLLSRWTETVLELRDSYYSQPVPDKDSEQLEQARLYEHAYIQRALACAETATAKERLDNCIARCVRDFRISFHTRHACEQAMVKNNMVCAQSLSETSDRLMQITNEDRHGLSAGESMKYPAMDAFFERMVSSERAVPRL